MCMRFSRCQKLYRNSANPLDPEKGHARDVSFFSRGPSASSTERTRERTQTNGILEISDLTSARRRKKGRRCRHFGGTVTLLTRLLFRSPATLVGRRRSARREQERPRFLARIHNVVGLAKRASRAINSTNTHARYTAVTPPPCIPVLVI